ncbi:MAG: hypothetical protein ABI699_19585 [Caldimonas sp.]
MKDLQSLQGYVNAKIAALAKVIKGSGSDAAIKELQSFQKWAEGPIFDRIGRIDDRIKKLEADAKK